MSRDVVEHAIRLLEREPARCMEARLLHHSALRGTGRVLSLDAFLDQLRTRPSEFVVIPPDPVFAAIGCDTVVALAAPAAADPEAFPAPRGILADVHETLALLLQHSANDESLHEAAERAVQELHALGCGLRRD